ncbi:MAG: hypothetical protein CR965_00545 [Paludibacter sp.]|nr:MAG: hypothetical protein CR965_00545 [Paludibacter sp.]
MIKRILTITILIATSLSLNAQTLNKDTVKNRKKNTLILYRVTAEYGESVMYGNRFVTSPYQIIRTGFNIELPIRYGFGIQTGLKYSFVSGSKVRKYAHYQRDKNSYNGHMLDIPIRATYTLPIFWGLKIFAFTGTNLNIGLSQKETIKFNKKQIKGITNPLPYPTSGTHNVYPDIYNRFNVQLSVGGGLQWKQFRLKGGYDWGMNDLYKSSTKTAKLKGWYAGFEYQF